MSGVMPSPHSASAVTLGSLNLTETFSTSCPSDLNFTVLGKSISWSMTPMCTLAGALGYLNVLSTLLVAGMMIGRGLV